MYIARVIMPPSKTSAQRVRWSAYNRAGTREEARTEEDLGRDDTAVPAVSKLNSTVDLSMIDSRILV